MFQPQDIAALLETAHDALRDDLLKALPAEQRHTGLMVANAMAVTLRYLNAGIEAGAFTAPWSEASAPTYTDLQARCRHELQVANPKRL